MLSWAATQFIGVSEQGRAGLLACARFRHPCPFSLPEPIFVAIAVLLLSAPRSVAAAPPRSEDTDPKPALVLKGHEGPVRSLAFALDGKSLFIAGGRTIGQWNLATGNRIREIVRDRALVHEAAFSPDRSTIAYGRDASTDIRLVERITGKELLRLQTRGPQTSFSRMTFSSCGTLLAAMSSSPYKVHLWDVASGKELHELQVHTQIEWIALSPDGRVVATASGDRAARLWDIRAGKELRRLMHPTDSHRVRRVAFSPDGKVLATIAWGRCPVLALWDVSTGEKLTTLGAPLKQNASSPREEEVLGRQRDRLTIEEVAFSPDGKWIVSAGRDHVIRLWELATGKEGGSWRSPSVGLVAFSPDGKTVACGANEFPNRVWLSSVSIWDRAAICRGNGEVRHSLRAEELTTCWAELSSDDAVRACRAVWTLVGAPAQAIERVEQYLGTLPSADPARIRQAIADLDARPFQVRQKASRYLASLGQRAKPALVAARTGQASAEARRRLERLLSTINDPLDPDRLRHCRLIEVLEHTGTRRARQALEVIGGGVLGESAASDAKGSLSRLAKRGLVD